MPMYDENDAIEQKKKKNEKKLRKAVYIHCNTGTGSDNIYYSGAVAA